MKYKMFIILNIEAGSFWQARDLVWKLIPENMKPFVQNVAGSEQKGKGWWGNIKSQLTGN